ncbi:hypothetical protein HF086_013420 [Spodoptera exigua]|uniref:CHK kinase-like domain-containing protein n=1 Tax=Spodoptera exigua TaxID=7107 RepID=A0A922SJS0_SPOEX|nr:hypothetical protein HF086_013420 [Spodoptera exigua]
MNDEMCEPNNQYICPNKISNKLEQCISDIAKRNGFVKYDIEKKEFCTNGGSYLGLLYEIDINGHTNDGEKEINIFVKSILPGDIDLQMLSVRDVYETEMFAYKIIFKIFDELQEEANVPVEERYKTVKSYEESDAEVILMENEAKKGFSTGHRMDVISCQFAEMAIAELAKFHSLSFVLKVKRPSFFEELEVKMRTSPYNTGDKWQSIAQNMIKITLDNTDEGIKERVEKFCENIGDRITSCYENESDGEISELIPIDYQMMYYGCPVVDFLYFIICCTDKEFRKHHLLHLKNLYHEAMARFLNYFDLDVNRFYTREDFEKDYEERLNSGLVLALVFLPFVFASEDDVPDLTKDDRDMDKFSLNVDKRYKNRIQGIIEDFIEWGVI